MENFKSVRWKQRFENFEKAFILLKKSIKIENPSEIERAGTIQFFEMVFELSWKVLKDYLESEGFDTKTPRETLKQSFQIELIDNGHVWIDALTNRNLTVHTYNEETALEVEKKIKNLYYPEIEKLYNLLKKKIT